jgi:SAM-dependent methyltransferase
MMNKDLLRKHFYQNCTDFLVDNLPKGRAEQVLAEHLDLVDGSQSPVSLEALYEGLLISGQNTQGKPNMIGGSIKGIHNLAQVTFGFNPHRVAEHYLTSRQLFEELKRVLKPTGRVNEAASGAWPKYCRTMLDAAKFMSQFKDGKDFYGWANTMYQDPRSQDAIPMLIAQHVAGIGYSLGCDFLKEKGFINFGKADVHIKDILASVGLCDKNAADIDCQRELRAIAKAVGVSTYKVDKLVWLIGSGTFYMASVPVAPILKSKDKFQKAWVGL